MKYNKIACLFPGQGAQFVGMAKEFNSESPASRSIFELADQILDKPLSEMILNGPIDELNQTKNCQTAIYVASMAMFAAFQDYVNFTPYVCAGLSLGEYTALTCGKWLTFEEALLLVEKRGALMNQACENHPGTMSVLMGFDSKQAEEIVRDVNLPRDLWLANFNCPGQLILSGTLKGIEAGEALAKDRGVKRVLRLNVHGAFHSGLMKEAEEELAPFIHTTKIDRGPSKIVMNVMGDFVESPDDVRKLLIKQVSHSVKWEQGIRAMETDGVDLYIEFGPGKTLSGMNKRIGLTAPTISIEKPEDLKQLEWMRGK